MATNTFEEFMSTYDPDNKRVIELDLDALQRNDEASPFVVIKTGKYIAVVNPMALGDHLNIDVHSFVDGKDARAGVFGMESGYRTELGRDGYLAVKGTSHGWNATKLVAVLIGEQKDR